MIAIEILTKLPVEQDIAELYYSLAKISIGSNHLVEERYIKAIDIHFLLSQTELAHKDC